MEGRRKIYRKEPYPCPKWQEDLEMNGRKRSAMMYGRRKENVEEGA
jgi:hypothetical protein